jgi:hypothetical protein
MPGGEDSFHLFRVKDGRSNSKADTFFVRPKQVGSEDFQPRAVYTESLDGAVTGGQRVEDLAGSNLSISGGSLQTTGLAADDASYVTTQAEAGLSNETVASSLDAVYGSPVGVGGADLRFNDGRAVEDAGGNPHLTFNQGGSTDVQRPLSFVNLTGTPTFGGHDHTAGGLTAVPAGGLDTPFTDLQAVYGSPVFVGSTNLRLATGQAIEDGSGTTRVQITNSDTELRSEAGDSDNKISVGDSIGTFVNTTSGFTIRDQSGAFNAVQYTTASSAPGTLELTNTKLDVGGNTIGTSTDSFSIDMELGNLRFRGPNSNDVQDPFITNKTGLNPTEIIAEDGAGNRTTLT